MSKAITDSNVKHSANECMYCWWKKSQTTTWDVWNPANNGINYLSTGYSFPSTVCVLCTRWPPLLTLYPQHLKPNKLMGRLMIHGYHHLAMILMVYRFLLFGIPWSTPQTSSDGFKIRRWEGFIIVDHRIENTLGTQQLSTFVLNS